MKSPRVVICGYPRSGSTMLYNMIRSTCTSHRTFDREVSAVGLREPAPWITKDPSDRRFPHMPAAFIVTVRDPRDVLCSTLENAPDRWKVSHDFTATGKREQEMIRMEGLVEIDAQCHRINGVVVRYETLCRDPNRVQKRLARKLGLDFTGRFDEFHLTEPPHGLAKQLNGLRPPSTGQIGAWRHHPERIREQFTACPALFDILETRGYEKDRTWFARL